MGPRLPDIHSNSYNNLSKSQQADQVAKSICVKTLFIHITTCPVVACKRIKPIIGSNRFDSFKTAMCFGKILSALVPFLQFAIKQYNDNVDMNCRLEQLSNYIEQVWRDILRGTVNDPELKNESRRLQDGIYDNRTLSPLIFDFFYKNQISATNYHEPGRPKLVDQYETTGLGIHS